MIHPFKKLFIGILFLGLFNTAHSKILKVESLANSGTGSLRDQIAAANANDTILINIKGTILIFGSPIVINKNLTIIGATASHTTIDLNSNWFDINMAGGNVIFKDMKITNFPGSLNAPLMINGGLTTTIINVLFEGMGTVVNGGAIQLMGNAILNLDNCSFFNNSTDNNGGALYVDNAATANVRNCTFSGNFTNGAGVGGAICNNGNLVLVNNTFLNNTSGSAIGHAVADNNTSAGSNTRIQNNIFTDASAPKYPDLLAGGSDVWISTGGNVFSNSSESFLSGGPNDLLSQIFTNLFLRVNPITDGYGLKYFTVLNPSSPVVDNGTTGANVAMTDCRRAPRALNGTGAATPLVDAGAVEFTPFTVTTNLVSGAGGLETVASNMNVSAFAGPKYMDFDISGGGPVTYASTVSITNSSSQGIDWFMDGFTQHGSVVPGPGNTPNSYTPAIYMVNIQNGSSDNVSLINPGINSFVAGLELRNTNGNNAIYVDGGNIHIYGNKLFSSNNMGQNGVYLNANNNAKIGGEYHFQRNVIGGNINAGIHANNNFVDVGGNFIGCNDLGSTDVSNNSGVLATGAICHVIGKIGFPSMNIISGNNTAQIDINNGIFNIQGNIIGPDFTMNTLMGPCQYGIHAETNTDGNVGGATPGSMNVIGGNSTGIFLQGCNAANVFGNFIGISPDGSAGFPSIPNSTGISIYTNGDASHFIGNGSIQARNYICNNSSIGIYMEDVQGHTIMGNFIGVKPDNLVAGNGTRGIHLVGASTEGNDILGNIIGGHTVAGIDVNGAAGSGNISGNKIGTDSTGMVARPNGRGIQVAATGPNSQIIGNLISGNTNEGIHLDNSIHTIDGNLIGMNLDTTMALPNGGDGLTLVNTNNCNIFNNYISGNGNNGILLGASNSNWIHGNHIGTNRIGMDFGNQLHGIALFFVSANNMIGGSSPLDHNSIMHNLGAGIDVERENSVTGIKGNHFAQNGIKAILLNTQTLPTAPLVNDLNDADVDGPAAANVGNNGQNYPDAISAVFNAGTCTVSGTMNVDNTTANYLIQVYKVNPGNIDASGHGEGDTLIAEQTFNASGLNTFSFSMNITGPVLGEVLSATASKIVSTNYETSEFSDTFLVRAPYTATIIDSTDVLCNGAADGRLEVLAVGSTNLPYTYQWHDGGGPITGATGSVYFGGPGTYFCVVTDAAAVSVNSDTATIIEPPLLTVTPTIVNPTCSGNCDGSIVLSETGGTPPYQYSIDNGSILQGSTTFLSLCSGIYQIYVVDNNGCATPTTGNSFTLNSPPALSLTPTVTNESCSGLNDGTITLSGSGGTGPFDFQVDGGGFSTTSTYINLAPGNHTIDIMDVNGCTSGGNVTILAGDLVTANFTTSFGTGCEDIFDFELTDASTSSMGSITTWNWSIPGGSPSGGTIPIISNIMFFTPGINNVTLNVVSSSGCTANVTLPVNVFENPIVDAGIDLAICQGTPFTQNASVSQATPATPYMYNWTPGGNFSNGFIEDGIVDVSVYGTSGSYTHTLDVVDANGCVGSDNMILTVNSLPTVNAGPDNLVCSGNPYTLSGSGSATLYTWDNFVTDGTSFTPAATTTYTVTGTDGNGCQATDQVTITVLDVVSNAGPDLTICNGQSQLLDGSASIGASSFQWYEVGGTNISSVSTANVAPSITTSYALMVTGGSCIDYDTVLVNVIGAPDASFAYSPSTFCINDADPVPISITTPGGIFSMPASSSINPSTGLISLSAIGVGTFDVVYTLSTPCFADDTFQIIVNPLPNVTVNGPLAMCINGNSFDLNSTFNPPSTGGTWSGVGVSGTNFDPAVSGAGTFGPIYTFTDGNGCTNADSVTLVVNALPVISISGVNPNYCVTDAPFVPIGTPAGGTFLIDAVNVGAITSVDPSAYSTGLHSINYQYTDPVTSCSNTTLPASFSIYNVPLDPTTSLPLNQTICSGASVSLVVANPNSVGGTALAWYADAAYTVFLANGPTFNSPVLTANTTYYVVVQNNGCKSNPLVFNITVNNAQVTAGPDLTICPGTPAQLNVNNSSGTISWSPGVSLDDSTIQNPLATPNVNTTYVVTVTSGPCSDSDSVNVIIDGSNPDCGITPSYNAFSPDLDGVNDTWIIDAIYNHPDNTVTIFNRWGDKLVAFEDYDNVNVVWDGTYNGNLLPSGTYFYVIEYHDINMQVSGWLQLTR